MNKANDEIWKPIDGYWGRYRISSYGRVMDMLGWNGRKYIIKPHLLKGSIQYVSDGYKRRVVTLHKGKGRGKDYKVHRLVASAFIKKPEGKNIVNHKDFNPLNNRVDNLEWVTDYENHLYSTVRGRRGYLNIQERQEILDKYKNGEKIGNLVAEYNVPKNVIERVIKKNGVKLDRHRGRKYDIDLSELLQEFKQGKRNTELAEKYGCSDNLIARRRYQFRKAGVLN